MGEDDNGVEGGGKEVEGGAKEVEGGANGVKGGAKEVEGVADGVEGGANVDIAVVVWGCPTVVEGAAGHVL